MCLMALDSMQVLEEHRRVFEYNIAIVRGFHVGYGRFILALQKLVPSWLYVAGILLVVIAWTAVFFSGKYRLR